MAAEIGIGIMALGAGTDFFITNIHRHRFNLSIGAYASYVFVSPQFPMLYFPLEASYTIKNDMLFKLNGGLLISDELTTLPNSKSYSSPWFGLSIGKRFGAFVKPSGELTINNVGGFLSRLIEKRPLPFRNTISISVGIHPLIGISYERLLFQYMGLQATAGVLSAGGGINLYFPGVRTGGLSVKTGVFVARSSTLWYGSANILYAPIGLNYVFRRDVIISADVGPQFESGNGNQYRLYGDIGFNVKIGKGF